MRRTVFLVTFMLIFLRTNGSPFYGLNVVSTFTTGKDVSAAALAASKAVFGSSSTILFATLPSSTSTINEAALGLNYLYYGVGNFIGNMTGCTASFATTINKPPVFKIVSDWNFTVVNAVQFLNTTSDCLASITAFAPQNGQALTAVFSAIQGALFSIQTSVNTIGEAVLNISSSSAAGKQISSSTIFSAIPKYQLTTLIAALNALTSQLTEASGVVNDILSQIKAAELLMSNYISTVATAYITIDGKLSTSYRTISSSSNTFLTGITGNMDLVQNAVANFNKSILKFNDSVIGANASTITGNTSSFATLFNNMANVLYMNSQETFDGVAGSISDGVLNTVEEVLYTGYQLVNFAIQNIGTSSTLGITCATSLTSYISYLSTNILGYSSCLSSNIPSTDPTTALQYIVQNMGADRLFYITLWNKAIQGLSNSSPENNRNTALAILNETSTYSTQINTAMLKQTLAIYAQLVSDFQSITNKLSTCLLLQSIETATKTVATTSNYFTCMRY